MKIGIGVVALAMVLAACSDDAITGNDPFLPQVRGEDWLGPSEAHSAVTVMTRNVYVGTNVDKILEASSAQEIPFLVAEAFQTLLSTDFQERAEAFAREIAEHKPHLVGLQEISTVRRQSPGDAAFGGAVPATMVLFDYLDILMDALGAWGLDYRVAAVVTNADVEVPMYTGADPIPFDDIRLTDFDVVLARGDIGISDVVERNYVAELRVPIDGGGVIVIPRGFTSVKATVAGNQYRFVNTHLEPADQATKQAQADELIGALQGETLPVILVGDLNTPAPDGPVYNTFLDAAYLDLWNERVNAADGDGFTANHADDLRNETVTLEKRIDFVLARNQPPGTRHRPSDAGRSVLGAAFAIVVGDELVDRTPSGLWPSDHAGVVVRVMAAPQFH